MKVRKIKHRTGKFFGWVKDRWARLGGRDGKKRSYGHYSGYADNRTRAELRDAAARVDALDQEQGLCQKSIKAILKGGEVDDSRV